MLLKKSGSLVVVLLLTGSGVLVQAGWSVAHSPGTVCALQGASVVLPCTYTYPSPYQVMKTIWFGVFNKQETNLESLSEYSGHWTYIGNRMNNCSLRITDLKNSYALEYRFRFETDISGGQFTGKPGVQLLVTDLQVMVNPDTVTEGQSVILTCSTTCTLTGSPAFIWYRDGSPLPFTNQSHLFTASREDRGNYTCAVKGYEHLPSSAVILSVTYGPKDTSLSVSPSGEILEGSSVTLTCSSDANPPVQRYTWYKNNRALASWTGSGLNHAITNIVSEDSGQYYCEARNQNGAENSSAVTIDVQYPPRNTLLSVSSSGKILEGSSVTLTCSSDANPPVQRYTWFKNNRAVASWTGSGLNHTISNIVSEDSGQYYCETQNQRGTQNSSAVTIDVQYAPRNTLLSVSSSGKILEGSSVTLTCSSDANPPVQRYTWFKNNRAVASWTGSGLNHTITNIVSEDSGQYYCETQNQHGTQNSSAVTIDVQYAPKNTSISVSPSGEIMAGSSVTLTCSSDANPPVQRYTWFKNNRAVASWTGSGLNHTITNIVSEDSGQYYCETRNQHGTQNSSAAVTIDVQFAPKDTSVSVSPSGEIVEGRSVNLTCSSDAKPPVQRYTWFKKNDTGVWQAGSGQSLNFSNFRSWNRGQYYCEAQNRHGAQNSTGLTVSYAAVANYKHDLAYIITGTCALAALLIVIVLAVCRRCHSVKEAKLNTEILQDAACAVYANVPGRTASTAPPGAGRNGPPPPPSVSVLLN
ncbi:B-cell receptor CD22-like isoform X2 [Anguilla anguilla]|uniref:B-cell receptor CD22-like isoform X2 n=1 Tax=Anguilla anguilla TaxID=7936 RepID=UPI0015AC2856|nr:B-cell receptor CD22-like isoform X2 [Anguilla anguilla]